MQITIKVYSMIEDVLIEVDSDKNLFKFNGQDVNLDIKNFCLRLVDITNQWQSNLDGFGGLDCERYNVSIKSNSGKSRTLYSNGAKLPDNYNDFTILLEEVENAAFNISR